MVALMDRFLLGAVDADDFGGLASWAVVDHVECLVGLRMDGGRHGDVVEGE